MHAPLSERVGWGLPFTEPHAAGVAIHALLLTDVVDSTLLAEQLGDSAMAALWAAHDAVARDLLPVHRGREIDKTDGFLLLFEAAPDAVAYALAYHQALRSLDPPIQARAGLHVGPVILTENAPHLVARGAKPLEVDGIAKPTAARVMSLAMGGQTLLTREALAALGETRLRVESHGHWRMKGVSEPMELFEVGGAGAPFTPPPDGAKVYRVVEQGDLWLPVKQVKHSLPAERDAFVGRRADLGTLARRLDGDARLISVLGIGGTGKTRLVTRYGWTWLGDHPGGVWFCDLSEARSVDGIVHAVARALDVPLGKGDPVVQLGHAIAGRGRCLVLLDNFEQVARHAAETLGRWLDRAGEAQFVVTSREVLGLPGEEALALAPLPATEGAALFTARARSAKRDFEPDDVASIDALVTLLDGLPLAIELAAARVRLMPPAKLLERMSQRFKLLASSGGRRDRQATLRATLDWSWELLSADEQAALAQLSVFEGGFTLDAAEAVLALDEDWPMDAVQALVDKSLVRRVEDDRFDLLVSVQEYAAEKLEAAGGRSDAEVRHGAHFAAFGTEEALDALDRHGGVVLGRALARELDNLVAASRRAVARKDGPGAAATALAAGRVLDSTGPPAVGVAVLDEARAVVADEALRGRLRAGLGSFLLAAGRVDEARAHLDAGLAAARAVGDRRGEGPALLSLARLHWREGRVDEAFAHARASLTVAGGIGDRGTEATALGFLGLLEAEQGRVEEARGRLEGSLAAYREIGDRRGEGKALNGLGIVNAFQGRMDEVVTYLRASLSVARECGDRFGLGMELSNLGWLEFKQGRLEEARAYFDEALLAVREIGDRGTEGALLGRLGRLLLAQGRAADGSAFVSQGERLLREYHHTSRLAHVLCTRARIERAQGDLPAARATLAEVEALAATLGAGPDSVLGHELTEARRAVEAPDA